MSFQQQYTDCLKSILNHGKPQAIGRNGSKTVALPNQTFRIDLNHYPLLGHRKLPIKLAIAEQLWFMAGTPDTRWFRSYSKAWDEFLNADGDIPTNYGMRYRSMRGDQIKKNLAIFKKDLSSRQVCFDIWKAEEDGHPDKPSKPNIPCLPFMTMNVIDGKLNVMLHQRSCDLVLGLPHDVAGVAFWANCWAKTLGVENGELLYCIANAHVYDNHLEAAAEMAGRSVIEKEIALTLGDFDPIAKAVAGVMPFDWASKVVEHCYEQIKSQYSPHDALSGLRITA